MKTKVLLTLLVGVLVLPAVAQDKPTQLDTVTTRKSALDWDETRWWQRDWNREEMKFSLGGRDFNVRGPLFETFRRQRRAPEDRNLGQKILDLPIVNLFVPQPVPVPTREGKYLAWGERDLPWATVADRGIPGPVGLLTVNW